MKILGENDVARHSKGLTVGDLIVLFLEWIEKKRSRQTFNTRKLYCTRFSNFEVSPGTRIANLPANKVQSKDLESWLDQHDAEFDVGPQTDRKSTRLNSSHG